MISDKMYDKAHGVRDNHFMGSTYIYFQVITSSCLGGLPDVSRAGSTQKKSGTLVGVRKVRKAHDVIKVRRDGIQVDPPCILTILLH